ncbi:unnamed protein product [Chironomus riparius]|uniref:Small RNA 2'-O-methyltransferase n=1 Tax=Chironomus riparius TaxID=315576 RepID=A0A9N9RPM2_9DIPT|nr:unnamed protein product [Chironomus riparius]
MDKFDIANPCTATYFNQEGHIIFDPCVYIQRYQATLNCLKLEQFKKKVNRIVEFGCAEMKFFTYIKTGLTDRKLWVKLVDIDEDLLLRCKGHVHPLLMDHVKKRENELNVEVWYGDVSINNPNFKDIDAVIAIELIEHLYPQVLDEVPYQIFENLNPKIAIFSTPNCEFNKVFDLEPGKFRHADHKFEWTREQFKDWCDHIIVRFPEYSYKMEGIGKPPIGYEIEDVGYSSQFALFVRNDILDFLNEPYESNNDNDVETAQNKEVVPESHVHCDGYILLGTIDYPVFQDLRSKIEKIIDEVCYHVNRYKYMEEQFYNLDNYRTEIPINLVTQACWETSTNEEEIANIIKERYQVENNFIIIEDEALDFEQQDEGDCQGLSFFYIAGDCQP